MALEEKLLLPYFYGQESEQFSFYRIPKALFSNPAFDDLSTDAKLLYGLLLDRMGLSVKNHWMDEQGRVFIYYTVESIMRDLHCANQKAAKLLAELEKKHGLIERKKQGLGKPDIIYVKNFVGVCMQQSHVQKCENHMSEDVKIMPQEMCISHSNDTDDSQNKRNKHESIYLSEKREEDTMETYENYRTYFMNQLSFDVLLLDYPHEKDKLEEIMELILETVCSNRSSIYICGDKKPAQLVKSRMMKLNSEHIRYILSCMKENTSKVRNIKQYLLAALYNAPMTISNYYSALVNHDMYGGGRDDDFQAKRG